MKLLILNLLLAPVLAGCMSTTIVYDPAWNRASTPSYVDHFDSYLVGFVGRNTVNINKVCIDQKPLALRRLRSFEDAFLTGLTVGIYTPTTIKVWCGD